MILILFMALTLRPAFGVEEQSLSRAWNGEVLPYFFQAPLQSFLGKGIVTVTYRVFPATTPGPQKALIIASGRTEFMEKYAELIFDLRNSGFAVYIFDHRGQGSSGRLLQNHSFGHVVHFQDYVDDFGAFVALVKAQHPTEVHVLAHSMGAAVATMYEAQHPGNLQSMVLTSPMYKILTGGYPDWMVEAAGSFMNGEQMAPGRSENEWDDAPSTRDGASSSVARQTAVLDFLHANRGIAIGGPTMRWVREAVRVGKELPRIAKSLRTPMLLLQAEDERVVRNDAQVKVCAAAADCQLRVLRTARHDMLIERDEVRDQVVAAMLDFFGRHPAR